MTPPPLVIPKTDPLDAFSDICDVIFDDYKLTFDSDGRHAFQTLFSATIGQYLTRVGVQAPDHDLWKEDAFARLPRFILGYVVSQIATRLQGSMGTTPVTRHALAEAAVSVLRDRATEDLCQEIVDYVKDAILQQRSADERMRSTFVDTPICDMAAPFPIF